MTIISINRWLFTNYPIKYLIKILHEMGFNSIELTAGEILRKKTEDLVSLRKHLDIYGFEVSAVNAVVSFVPYIHGSITSKISWRREKFLQQLKKIIEKMSILRCPRLIVSPGCQAENYQTRNEAWKTTIESLRYLGKYATQYCIEILLEAMPFRLPFNSSRDVRRMVEEANQPNVYAAMDTGHVYLAGENLKIATETLGDYLRYIHLSNVQIEAGKPLLDEHRPLDSGTIDIKEYINLLSMLKNIPVAINVVTSGDPIACAKKCLQLIGNSHR